LGTKNRKAVERRHQKNLEKKKKRRLGPEVKRRKGRGRKLPIQKEALTEDLLSGSPLEQVMPGSEALVEEEGQEAHEPVVLVEEAHEPVPVE